MDDFIDGVIGATGRAPVAEHLARCADCRSEIAELSALVGIARADATLVVAPPFLEVVVLATTVQQRVITRHVLRELRLPLVMAVLILVLSFAVLTGWVLTACTSTSRGGTVDSCREPWYFVVRDGARERYKEVRDEQRLAARKVVNTLRH